MSHVIFRRNDNLIEWEWLSRATDGEYINDGTVTFTLYSGYSLVSTTGVLTAPSGAVNLVAAGPTSMAYVTGSNGKYQGKLASSVALDLALAYTLEINAQANGHTARRSIPVTVVDRTT
jgi:hypothetical protein